MIDKCIKLLNKFIGLVSKFVCLFVCLFVGQKTVDRFACYCFFFNRYLFDYSFIRWFVYQSFFYSIVYSCPLTHAFNRTFNHSFHSHIPAFIHSSIPPLFAVRGEDSQPKPISCRLTYLRERDRQMSRVWTLFQAEADDRIYVSASWPSYVISDTRDNQQSVFTVFEVGKV